MSAATLAEAAAGTLNTVFSSPQTAVPKSGSGMTGAAIIPGGVNGGRPGTPSGGMFRYNTTYTPDTMEFYDAAQAAWIALATLPQLQDVSLDVYSNFSAGNGGFTDLPAPPFGITRNTVVVPAGYTNFMVYSSVAFQANYNTTGGGTSVGNTVVQNGTDLGYQAMFFPSASNVISLQVGTSVFVSATSAVGVSNTFTQRNSKTQPVGPIIPNDSSLLVFAWTV